MLKIFGVAAALMLSSAGPAQPDLPDEWLNSVSTEATADLNDPYEETVAEHSASLTYEGVGGPVEERTGYPPCAPDPADDNCIQLYESGVTGSGN